MLSYSSFHKNWVKAIGVSLGGVALANSLIWINEASAASTSYTVSFRTYSGKHYVVAEDGGGGAVNANRTVIGPWEKFTLVDLNGGEVKSGDAVNIRASNGMYVVAEGGGGGAVNANRTTPGPWEKFVIKKVNGSGVIMAGDSIALQTSNGKNYVVAQSGGGGIVKADRTKIGPWEKFTLTAPLHKK
jgi:hypothetical protein